MTKDEYVKTFEICGQKVDLGLDDYGQCYFIEWTDSNGEEQSVGLGTYNFNYMEQIYYMFDGRYKELARKELFGDLSDGEKAEMQHYADLFEEEYKFYGNKNG